MGDMYALSAAVGPSCPNRKLDVMLVQLLLLKYGRSSPKVTMSGDDLDVDGLMGPETAKAILKFQKENADYCPVLDGKIDPGYQTMARLVMNYQQNYNDYCRRPWQDPDCPGSLKRHLASKWEPYNPVTKDGVTTEATAGGTWDTTTGEAPE
jgi:hypothetical protein